jgi:sulfatase modifying factor 1
VRIGLFRMMVYEITFDGYDALSAVPRRSRPDDVGWGLGKRPLINVSWEAAVARGCVA